MIKVRQYDLKDRDRVCKICYDNSSDNALYRDNPNLLLTLFCDYYIDEEPENCFVAVNDKDEAVGYVISSSDFTLYKKRYKPYMKRLLKFGIKHYIDKLFANFRENGLSKEYPAHLHIDIDNDYQRQGIGSKLLDKLHLSLKDKGIKGIHLETGKDNEKAVNFYYKYGYEKIGDKGMVFGIKLQEWEAKGNNG